MILIADQEYSLWRWEWHKEHNLLVRNRGLSLSRADEIVPSYKLEWLNFHHVEFGSSCLPTELSRKQTSTISFAYVPVSCCLSRIQGPRFNWLLDNKH